MAFVIQIVWTGFFTLLSLFLLSLLAGAVEEPVAGQAINPTHEWKLSQLTLRGLAFFRDGKRLLVCRGFPFAPEELTIWDIATGKDIANDENHRMAIQRMALSADGMLAAVAGGRGEVKLFETKTFKILATFDGSYEINHAIAFSTDGRILASSGDKVVKVWDTKTFKEIAHLTEFSLNGMRALVFSPDGKHLVVGDLPPDAVWVYDTANYKTRRKITLQKDEVPSSFAFAPGGKYMAWTVSGPDPENPREVMLSRMGLVDLETGKEVVVGERFRTLVSQFDSEHMPSVACAPDGKFVLAGTMNGKVRIMDARTGKTVRTFLVGGEIPGSPGCRYPIRHLAISPDGKILATGGDDGYVRLWNLTEILRPHRR